MSEENTGTLDTSVQDDVSTDSDNNDTLNETVSKNLYENQKIRAEKAEAEKKTLKEALENALKNGNEDSEEKPKEKSTPTGLSREEAILFAKGLTEEEVEKASKIAQIEGVSLLEATSNEMFIAWKNNKEAQKKSEQASLSTSKGSPKVPEKKDFSTPGLSSEEHQELFRNRNK